MSPELHEKFYIHPPVHTHTEQILKCGNESRKESWIAEQFVVVRVPRVWNQLAKASGKLNKE